MPHQSWYYSKLHIFSVFVNLCCHLLMLSLCVDFLRWRRGGGAGDQPADCWARGGCNKTQQPAGRGHQTAPGTTGPADPTWDRGSASSWSWPSPGANTKHTSQRYELLLIDIFLQGFSRGLLSNNCLNLSSQCLWMIAQMCSRPLMWVCVAAAKWKVSGRCTRMLLAVRWPLREICRHGDAGWWCLNSHQATTGREPREHLYYMFRDYSIYVCPYSY